MCVYIGIDWSQDKHDVAIMCEDGCRLLHFVMPHKQDGFAIATAMPTTRPPA